MKKNKCPRCGGPLLNPTWKYCEKHSAYRKKKEKVSVNKKVTLNNLNKISDKFLDITLKSFPQVSK